MGTIYNFTTCGATRNTGPTQAQADTAYASTSLAGLVTSTNGVQKFVVPYAGNYKITMAGAQGGNTASGGHTVSDYKNGVGGLGSQIVTTTTLKQGDVLYIWVGQQGWSTSGNDRPMQGGFGGGFGGGCNSTDASMSAGTGGGASAIAKDTNTYAARTLVAAGGGGAGWSGIPGGGGGIDNGADAYNDSRWSGGYGRGGSQSAGGSQGTGMSGATAGTLGDGGRGIGNTAGGGGGGGGYYGGGGAYIEGGGGGSSLITGTVVNSISATQSGNGFVTLESQQQTSWLIYADNKWYTIKNNTLTQITDTSSTKSNLFLTQGVSNRPELSYYQNLNNPRLYYWQELPNQAAPYIACDITFVPNGQVVAMLEDIDISAKYIQNLQQAKAVSTVVGSPVITLAISLDGGITYYAYKNNTWNTVGIDPNALATGGTPLATWTSLNADQWASLFAAYGKHNYRLAVYMELTDGSQQVTVNSIEMDYKNNL